MTSIAKTYAKGDVSAAPPGRACGRAGVSGDLGNTVENVRKYVGILAKCTFVQFDLCPIQLINYFPHPRSSAPLRTSEVSIYVYV